MHISYLMEEIKIEVPEWVKVLKEKVDEQLRSPKKARVCKAWQRAERSEQSRTRITRTILIIFFSK